MNIISSKANNLIKKTKKLAQKKYRQHSYLIEGWHLYEEASQNNANIERIFVLEDYLDRLGQVDAPVVVVTPEVLKELSESPTPQGIVCQVQLQENSLPELLEGTYLLLEDVQDPGNVGTMIRTADAAGFTGVLLSDRSADIYNQKTLRSMQGSHFHLPIYRGPMTEILAHIENSQLPLIATTLSSRSVDYRSVNPGQNFVLAMGNEGQGISTSLEASATSLAHISMPGQAESLNVAVAAGIMMFHLIVKP